MEAKRKVKIKTLENKVYAFETDPEISILDFKKLVESTTGIAVQKQRLIYKAKLLKDEQKLSEFIKEDDETIHLIVRTEQAQPQPEPAPAQQPTPERTMFGQLPSIFSGMIEQIMPQAQAIASQIIGGGPRPAQPSQPRVIFGTFEAPLRPPQPSAPPAGPESANVPRVHLPHEHVMAIGAIVNSLMGPGSSFPEPVMPQLNVPRNSLTGLGVYLHNYQFQLTRLAPFISRLADLLQRESLITNSWDRQQTQAIARHVGQALHEIVYATAPIAHLVRDLQIGEEPGAFRMVNRPNPDLAPFAASHIMPEAAGASAQRPPAAAVDVPLIIRPAGQPLAEPQERELASALDAFKGKLNEVSALPKQEGEPMTIQKARTLADFIKVRVDQILSQKAWHAKAKDLLPDGMLAEKVHEKILMEVLSGIPIHEGYEIVKGNFEALVVAIPTILRVLLTVMGGQFTAETRKTVCRNVIEELKSAIIVPGEIKKNMLPGFEPISAIERILERYFNEFMLELVEFDRYRNRARFSERIRFLLIRMIGESISELNEGFNNEYADVDILIKHNTGLLLKKIDSDGLGVLLDYLVSAPLHNFIERSYKLYKEEEDKKKKETQKKQEEETKAKKELPKAAEEIKKVFAPPAEEEKAVPTTIPEKWKETIEKDVKAQENLQPQKPFSHAYIATDARRGPQSVQRVTESMLKKELREAMQGMNLDKEDIIEIVGDVGEDLEAAYVEYLKLEFEKRIKEDSDFDPEKHKYLDKFIKKKENKE